jgi:DNA-binding beta-propeller fold protein YncE/cytochrome c5
MKNTIFLVLILLAVVATSAQNNPFHSPVEVAFSPDGKWIATTDFTKGSVYFVDAEKGEVMKEVKGMERPFGIVWMTGERIAVSEYGSHVITLINTGNFRIENRIPCVTYPMGFAKIGNEKLIVCGFGKNEAGIVDLTAGQQTKTIPVWNQPGFVAVMPDGDKALVSNLTPGSSDNGSILTMIDLKKGEAVKNIELPFGTSNVHDIEVSPDGKWGYVAHTYGRVMLPTTQTERGWINTNVFSIIDLQAGKLYATLPFDFVIRGGADPWGLDLSKDGSHLYATLAGVNELAVIKLNLLHRYLSGESRPPDLRSSDANAEIARNIWGKIYENPEQRHILADQFSALYAAGLLERIKLPVQGARGISVSPDGHTLGVAGYFSGNVVLVQPASGKIAGNIRVGDQPAMTMARKGEQSFHDAGAALQSWLSCATCHPAGRADGLNWDLMNDGIGNPKNAKSLLLSHATPPSMSLGVRSGYEVAVEKGFSFIQFHVADTATIEAVKAYLREMQPDISPFLNADGKLTAKAIRGKKIFESREAGCAHCHNGPYYTDMKMYNVGTKSRYESRETFDNPTLTEVWRTAPYLHDGSASTLKEVLIDRNVNDRHGKTSHLSDEEIEALIEYVRSL